MSLEKNLNIVVTLVLRSVNFHIFFATNKLAEVILGDSSKNRKLGRNTNDPITAAMIKERLKFRITTIRFICDILLKKQLNPK